MRKNHYVPEELKISITIEIPIESRNLTASLLPPDSIYSDVPAHKDNSKNQELLYSRWHSPLVYSASDDPPLRSAQMNVTTGKKY